MKKIVIATALIVCSLFAEVVTVLPYGAQINYDKSSLKSAKDTATLYGFHTSVGNLSYLLEADYAKIDTSYKDKTIENLNQDDISLAYARYFTNFMLRGGVHYINTNDEQLGDGYIAFGTLGGYNYYAYDKLSYGIEGYYSYYDKGHDEDYVAKSISIIQISPYISYYEAISLNWGNTLIVRYNYQIADDYVQNSYGSYEVSDTIFYKQAFITLKGYSGEMRTGIKDSGFTVFNTLDLMKTGVGAKIGITFAKTATLALSYDINTYEEYAYTQDGTNSVVAASLSFKL